MDKISKLLSALLERTEDRRLDWHETIDENAFHYSLPDSTIGIARNDGVYSITIYNETGRVAKIVTDGELDADLAAGGKSRRELMEHLYDAARRSALQAESTIDGILSQLGVEA